MPQPTRINISIEADRVTIRAHAANDEVVSQYVLERMQSAERFRTHNLGLFVQQLNAPGLLESISDACASFVGVADELKQIDADARNAAAHVGTLFKEG